MLLLLFTVFVSCINNPYVVNNKESRFARGSQAPFALENKTKKLCRLFVFKSEGKLFWIGVTTDSKNHFLICEAKTEDKL